MTWHCTCGNTPCDGLDCGVWLPGQAPREQAAKLRRKETPMTKYRKKPVVIDATRWFKNGDHPLDYSEDRTGFENNEFRTWSGEEAKALAWEGGVVRYYRSPDQPGDRQCQHCEHTMHYHGWIDTLEGGHIVCPGDWIITGVAGEHYPCKPDIFERTYEAERDADRQPEKDQ